MCGWKIAAKNTMSYTGLALGLRPANERRRISLDGRKSRISPDIFRFRDTSLLSEQKNVQSFSI